MTGSAEPVSRRSFLGTTMAAGAGLVALGAGEVSAAEAPRSRVVRARRQKATVDLQPNQPVVTEAVHAAVMGLSGKSTPAAAWAEFLRPDDVVGLKINCLFGIGASTHPQVVAAVIEGCKLAKVKPENIIVWDRTDSDLAKVGYRINRGPGVRCYGVNKDWEPEPVAIHTCRGRLAKLVTTTCTALINLPILKTHSMAGMTLALKNHYGTFHNPWDAHANACDPFAAHVNLLPQIRTKTRLVLADALLPIAEGGPGPQPQWTWPFNAILASRDSVAIDYVGMQILDKRRAELGLKSLEKSGAARHVLTAARLGLGTADLSRIDLVDV